MGTSVESAKLSTNATSSPAILAATTAGTDSGPGRRSCKATATRIAPITTAIRRIARRPGSNVSTLAIASATKIVNINQVTPLIRSTPNEPMATSYLLRSNIVQPAPVTAITAPRASMEVARKRSTPPGRLKIWRINTAKTPTATAPLTGASHSSVVVVENRAVTGSNATSQMANKPAIPRAAEIPQRQLGFTSLGQASANITTSPDITNGPVLTGRLGKNTVITASSAAAVTVVTAKIVLRTLLSCHDSVNAAGCKTAARRNLTKTVSVVA